MVIRVLKNIRERMNELSENLYKENVSINKGIETIKKNQSEYNIWNKILGSLQVMEMVMSHCIPELFINSKRSTGKIVTGLQLYPINFFSEPLTYTSFSL